MPSHSDEKRCVILLAMGGPDSLSGVRRYLVNIFSDRSIIKLPGGPLFQRPFAYMIAQIRHKKVEGHYQLIGGCSPLLGWTEAQRALVQKELTQFGIPSDCRVAMRYYTPIIGDVIREAYRDGFRSFCFVPMYPQYCRATTGSSFEEVGRSLKGLSGVTTSFVKDYHDHPGYVAMLRSYIDANIQTGDTLLFSAHSIPQSFVDDGDPYVAQVKRTAQLAAGAREYQLSFQSRTGPVSWVGPDTIAESRRLLESTSGNLFVVPISFVCDHIETLYEIDIELKQLLGPKLGARIRRMPMFNDDFRYGHILADLVKERVMQNGLS